MVRLRHTKGIGQTTRAGRRPDVDGHSQSKGAVGMLVTMCKAKIHRVTVTDANLRYEGSVTVDERLLDAAGVLPGEQLHVVNLNNGHRLETYAMPGTRGSGTICMNGAAARLAAVGDQLILIAYGMMDEARAGAYLPRVVYVDERNRLVRVERKR